MNEGFHFHTQYSLVELLGINVKESAGAFGWNEKRTDFVHLLSYA